MVKVSVIIPSYNYAAFLPEAIASVLSQTHRNLELIIIDDGSTDFTPEVCQTWVHKDRRVRYFRQPNSGLSAARNRGINIATGSVFAFLDADDFWLPQKLTKQLEMLERVPSAGAVYCDFLEVDTKGNIMPSFWKVRSRSSKYTLYEKLLFDNVILSSGSGVIALRECFERVGLFDKHLIGTEDIDMWRRIAQYYSFAYVPEPLVCIRRHENSIQIDGTRMADGWIAYVEKFSADLPREYMGTLQMAKAAGFLKAASYARATDPTKSRRALWRAVESLPRVILSIKFWGILILSVTNQLVKVLRPKT